MQSAVLFYQIQLLSLALGCLAFLYVDRLVARKHDERQLQRFSVDHAHITTGKPSADALKRKYLVVYGILMGADWLQGPYLYSLYREQYQFPERVVALLFVTGFLSAGMAAPFIGSWADQHGRRKACLLFCITYTLSCVCITLPVLPVLLFGRVLGGVSTSILFSVFETWLVSESNSVSLPAAELSTIMGRATLLNGFMATSAGVISNQLVSMTGDYAVPFIASGTLLVIAWIAIRAVWTENYGSTTTLTDDVLQLARLRKAWRIVSTDPSLIVLGLTQTCFEGTMYLFVFLWVPSLQESSSARQLLPLGYIFSCFMISLMLGSLVYTAIITHYQRNLDLRQTPSTRLHAQLSSIVSALGAISLGLSVVLAGEYSRFWAFCVYECCVGMYYPIQGTLRAGLITDEHRATVSSLFRVPLNVFVIVSLLAGVSDARTIVFMACAGMLTVSSLLTAIVIGGLNASEDPGHQRPPLIQS